jgi:PPP family 3-phenylpropionic acid transporter
LLGLGGAAGLLRWTVTALTANLGVLIAVQLLHAFTFGAAHLGAMHYLARQLPPEHAATGQTFYSAITGGVGFGLITLGAGALYGAVGAGAYYAMALAAALGAVLAALLARLGRQIIVRSPDPR